MGAVYRSRDDSFDRMVALKVMHPAVAVGPSFVSRFHREARAASRLDHLHSMCVTHRDLRPENIMIPRVTALPRMVGKPSHGVRKVLPGKDAQASRAVASVRGSGPSL
jgi:serine/threonine protein kinase